MRSDAGFGAPVLLVTLALVGLTCLAFADVANVLVARQRAQAAADAAALAAAAAQWTATSDDDEPADAAEEVSGLNGATLESCRCDPRRDGAEVEVSVPTRVRMLRVAPSVVRARAAARIDRGRLFQPAR